MKRLLIAICILVIPAVSFSATLSWNEVTAYTDSAPIDTFKTIRYTPYSGPADPPTSAGTPVFDVLTTTMPDPAPGQTMYYSVTATVVGEEVESALGAAASKTSPFQVPAAPTGITVR